MSTPERPVPERGRTDLLPEISREIDQVAHFGSAPKVKDLIVSAGEAIDAGDHERAVTALLEAKTKAPRSVHVREMLGVAFHHLGRWRDAARELAAYRRLSDRRDRDPEYADCERALGRPEKAVEILSDITAQELPEEVLVEGLVVAAGALTDLGRHADAVAMLERGPLQPPRVLPHHLRLFYALADALELAGRRSDARGWWDAIYAEDPEFFDVAKRRLGIKPAR
jgi:tetratricopeptide (TPR) repeat protein